MLIVNFFAVNELQGYLVITASDSDKKHCYFILDVRLPTPCTTIATAPV